MSIHDELKRKTLELENNIKKHEKNEKSLKSSAAIYQTIFNYVNDAILIFDIENGNTVNVNQAILKMFEYPKEELLSMDMLSLVDKIFSQSCAEAKKYIKESQKGKSQQFECKARKKTGDIFWVEIKLEKTTFDDKECIIAVIKDISDSKQQDDKKKKADLKYKAIIQTAVDGFWITDLQGHFLEVNDAYCRMSGYSEDELLSMQIPQIEGTMGPEEVVAKIKEVENRGYSHFDTKHRRKDGGLYDVEVIIQYLKDDNGRLSIFLRDISERKRMEQALQERENFQRALFQTIPDLVWIKDADGVYLACNTMFRRLYNAQEKEIIGKTDYDFVEKNLADFFREHDKKAIAAGKSTTNEEWVTFASDGHQALLETVKTPMFDDDGKLIGVLGVARDITLRKQTEDSLKETQKKLEEAQKMAHLGFWVWNVETDDVEWSDEVYRIFKLNPKEFSPTIDTILALSPWPEEQQRDRELIEKTSNSHDTGTYEQRFLFPDGTTGYYFSTYKGIYDEADNLKAIKGTIQDITKKKQAEEEQAKMEKQLQQVQKMDSIGRLAGGIAHDFNNMLTVILGYTEMTLMQVNASQQIYTNLIEIQKAAEHSSEITKQLLAFARKQTITPKVLDLNKIVEKMLKMIRRLIGEDISLKWIPGKNLSPIKIDPTQIDQILVNLCVNARDAIKGVGKITIETDSVNFDEEYCENHLDFAPGYFVLLSISDSGCGMDKDTLQKIFEPFFTTKDIYSGTGLGLATVYGIVKQNAGFINVYSEPDIGTTFKIYFPPNSTFEEQGAEKNITGLQKGGKETILLVEDDLRILNMVEIILEKLGYNVLSTNSPKKAIKLARDYHENIDLLVTDVIMPEMNGRELVNTLITDYPDLKYLYMSGYTENVISHHGVLAEGINFIPKPFTSEKLSQKVFEALNSKNENIE